MPKTQSSLDPFVALIEPTLRRIVREEVTAALAIAQASEPVRTDGSVAMSLEAAAKLSGLGMTSIKAAARDGRLKTVRHGRRRLVLPDDLRAFVAG